MSFWFCYSEGPYIIFLKKKKEIKSRWIFENACSIHGCQLGHMIYVCIYMYLWSVKCEHRYDATGPRQGVQPFKACMKHHRILPNILSDSAVLGWGPGIYIIQCAEVDGKDLWTTLDSETRQWSSNLVHLEGLLNQIYRWTSGFMI